MRFSTWGCIAALLAAVGLATALPASAQSKACQLEISGNDALQFDKKELKVGAGCKEITLTLKHIGKAPAAAMGHNWVLVRTADMAGVVNDGMKAGLTNQYLKPSDKRVIASTKVVGGGESTTIRFSTEGLRQGEPYTYVCTFPGHSAVMRGTLTIG